MFAIDPSQSAQKNSAEWAEQFPGAFFTKEQIAEAIEKWVCHPHPGRGLDTGTVCRRLSDLLGRSKTAEKERAVYKGAETAGTLFWEITIQISG